MYAVALQVAYANPGELWRQVQSDKDKSWYAPAVEYWDKQPASYDGVLAGTWSPWPPASSWHCAGSHSVGGSAIRQADDAM